MQKFNLHKPEFFEILAPPVCGRSSAEKKIVKRKQRSKRIQKWDYVVEGSLTEWDKLAKVK